MLAAYGGHNRHAVPGFCKRQQRLRRPALDEDIGFQPREAAGRIKRFANYRTRVHEQERVRGKRGYVDVSRGSECERGMAGGKKFHWRQRITAEGVIFGLYRLHQADAEMDVAAFQFV